MTGPLGGALRRIGHALRVTFLLEDGGQTTRRLRSRTLVALVAIAFAVLGTVRTGADWAGPFGESPFELDYALRVVSAGWFSTSRTAPVALVDIDEQTHRAWGAPAITPRADLARLLQIVTAAQPAAVFVDIDLSGVNSPDASDAGDRALMEFLERYRGAALVAFPKRLDSDGEGVPQAATSPYDPLVARNPRLRWAHAAFDTDTDGKVRAWREWLMYCSATGLQRLPAVPIVLDAATHTVVTGAAPPAKADRCDATDAPTAGAARRLLLGPRLTGPGAHRLMPDATTVSAALLLDRDMMRDDGQLFSGRTVFIGASHASSGDLWLTPSGVYPGVELLANMARFAPVEEDGSGWLPRAAHRVFALALFGAFAWLNWHRRGQVAVALATLLALTYLVIAVAGFDDFAAFDVLEAAILMMIVYKGVESLIDFGGVLRTEWLRTTQDQRWSTRVWQTLAAASRKPQVLPTGEGHGDPPH